MQTRSNRTRQKNRFDFSFYKKWWFWIGIVVLAALVVQCSRQNDPKIYLHLDNQSTTLNKQLSTQIQFETNRNNKYTITDQKNNQEIAQGTAKSGNAKVTLHNAGKFKLTVKKNNQSLSKKFTVKPLKVTQKKITATLEDNGDNTLANNNGSEVATTTPDNNAPKSYQDALNLAKDYSDKQHMSKEGIYDQLTSNHGTKYSNKAAQYAIDNLQADYNYNALQKAKGYQKTLGLSENNLRDKLTSQTGDQFTDDEATYALQHLND